MYFEHLLFAGIIDTGDIALNKNYNVLVLTELILQWKKRQQKPGKLQKCIQLKAKAV